MQRFHKETNHMIRQEKLGRHYDGPYENNPAYRVIYRKPRGNCRKMKAMACRCKSGCGCKIKDESIKEIKENLNYKEILNEFN